MAEPDSKGRTSLSRTPPVEVRRQLRREVGFGCPIPDCRSPWLTYHHFDPEWHVQPHHEPAGMIPLCPTHHAQAAAWTPEQLREFKSSSTGTPPEVVAGRFQWLRRRVLGVVGGHIYYETPILVQFDDDPLVWFERDNDGYVRLNLRMITAAERGTTRTVVHNNDFVIGGHPVDVDCPPSGRRIAVHYNNGDSLTIEFRAVETIDAAVRRWPDAEAGLRGLPHVWPMTAIEVTMDVGEIAIRFGPGSTSIDGVSWRGCVSSESPVGFVIRSRPRERPAGIRRPFTEQARPSPTSVPSPRGRNQPCWCGSSKKYKHCHLEDDRAS